MRDFPSSIFINYNSLYHCRWDDNRIRAYLEKKGVIKSKQEVARDQLFAKMRESYTGASDPAYQAWSDSYIVSLYAVDGLEKTHANMSPQRTWLVNHGLLKTDAQKTRDQLVSDMNKYYYGTQVCEKRYVTYIVMFTPDLTRTRLTVHGPTPKCANGSSTTR